jgi:hypothetical protein
MKEDFSELDLSSFCLFYANQQISKHSDRSGIKDRPTDICKINFFLHDSESAICVETNDKIDYAPAIANTGWLLNASQTHWTTLDCDLFMLQLCFYQPYDRVLAWFDSHPNLTYSSAI